MVSQLDFGARYSMPPRDLASSRFVVISCTKFGERPISPDGKNIFMYHGVCFSVMPNFACSFVLISSVVVGAATGATAAFISCPMEVACVRMSNDATLPAAERRNYRGILDVVKRIYTEEGAKAFWRGSIPFSQRAALVGVFQVATLDQFTDLFEKHLKYKKNTIPNVFCSAMSSGLIYSIATMPLEASKNRMASQTADKVTGKLPYTSTLQTMRTVSANEGFLALYNGFFPYYTRCGGHTVCMFIAIQVMREYYTSMC